MKERLKALLKAWTVCSGREGRRILLLIPLLVLIALLFLWQGKPRFERSFTMYGDRALDSSYRAKNSRARAAEYRTDSVRPFLFDPNTVDRDGLLRLGFSPKQADGIVHYRQAGAVFRTAADFARCRMVSADRYRKLEPYIRIDSVVGRREELLEKRGAPDSVSGPVELNGADSAALVAVRGIGPLTAGRIVRYRERLGGFARIGQLREIEGMTDENYRRILQQIWVDSSKIQKIDINFALPLQLRDHPYLPERVLNRLLKYRQLKGGWRSIRDLTEQHIISEQQAEKLSPYLCFRVQ